MGPQPSGVAGRLRGEGKITSELVGDVVVGHAEDQTPRRTQQLVDLTGEDVAVAEDQRAQLLGEGTQVEGGVVAGDQGAVGDQRADGHEIGAGQTGGLQHGDLDVAQGEGNVPSVGDGQVHVHPGVLDLTGH